ncbi:MAG: tetratricopeptide repeat protein [Treponema sp.]|jgi:tetratricopeptide (TPR) repeat protein|nr:tetratricopeptide repeat protein [Treponema sp.]
MKTTLYGAAALKMPSEQLFQQTECLASRTASGALRSAPFALFALILLSAAFFPVSAQEAPSWITGEENSADLEEKIDELMRTGIYYHDEGDYDKAIECYKEALELAPELPGIYYELAFSYLYRGDPEDALQYAQKGIDISIAGGIEDSLAGLYDIKGSALDDLDRHEEAVAVYLEALDRFDVNNTRLYYNLGLTYYRMGERDKARESLAQSLLSDSFHPSSNLLLGKICYEQGRKSQSLYCLCYFLLLEPYTDRSAEAYSTIKQLTEAAGGIITISNTGSFTAADMMLSLLFTDATDGGSDDEETPDEQLMRKLERFFSFLDEQPDFKKAADYNPTDDLWWDFYVPFFARLAKSEHFRTFCRYIGMSGSAESGAWVEENEEKIEAMFGWLNEEPEEMDDVPRL